MVDVLSIRTPGQCVWTRGVQSSPLREWKSGQNRTVGDTNTRSLISRSVPGALRNEDSWQMYLMRTSFYNFFFKNILIIYLTASGLSCGTWDLIPWPGVESRAPPLGVRSLIQGTTSEFSHKLLERICFMILKNCFLEVVALQLLACLVWEKMVLY